MNQKNLKKQYTDKMKFIEDLVKKNKLNKHYKKLLYSLLILCELRFDFACAKCKEKQINFYKSLNNFYGFEKDKIYSKSWEKLNEKLKKMSLEEAIKNKKRIINSLFKNSKITYDYIKKRDSCFSWKVQDETEEIMGIHFKNAILPKNPFRDEEFANRRKEMKKMLIEVKKEYPKIKKVFGSSWMYNLDKYNDLHSKDFVKNLKIAYSHKNKTTAYWGQFLCSDGSFNETRALEFRNKWKFPFKRLTSEAPIESFFKMYNIKL